jgi:hypothetical protein
LVARETWRDEGETEESGYGQSIGSKRSTEAKMMARYSVFMAVVAGLGKRKQFEITFWSWEIYIPPS